MKNVVERIKSNKIIAIIRGIGGDKIVRTCEALIAGGIECIEVTFDQSSAGGEEDTYNAIRTVDEAFGERICLGAGTVMSVGQAELAVRAGAKYIISPNYDKDVVAATVALGAVSMPGALTPSEIAGAYRQGASFVKIFPASSLGPEYIKAIKAPISHVPLIAVGGIDVDNCMDYLNAGAVGVGVGSCLVSSKLVDRGEFDELTRLAAEFTDKIKGRPGL